MYCAVSSISRIARATRSVLPTLGRPITWSTRFFSVRPLRKSTNVRRCSGRAKREGSRSSSLSLRLRARWIGVRRRWALAIDQRTCGRTGHHQSRDAEVEAGNSCITVVSNCRASKTHGLSHRAPASQCPIKTAHEDSLTDYGQLRLHSDDVVAHVTRARLRHAQLLQYTIGYLLRGIAVLGRIASSQDQKAQIEHSWNSPANFEASTGSRLPSCFSSTTASDEACPVK